MRDEEGITTSAQVRRAAGPVKTSWYRLSAPEPFAPRPRRDRMASTAGIFGRLPGATGPLKEGLFDLLKIVVVVSYACFALWSLVLHGDVWPILPLLAWAGIQWPFKLSLPANRNRSG